jgi:hypothetical protein
MVRLADKDGQRSGMRGLGQQQADKVRTPAIPAWAQQGWVRRAVSPPGTLEAPHYGPSPERATILLLGRPSPNGCVPGAAQYGSSRATSGGDPDYKRSLFPPCDVTGIFKFDASGCVQRSRAIRMRSNSSRFQLAWTRG